MLIRMKRHLLILAASALAAFNCMAADWKEINISSHITGVQPMTGLVLWPEEANRKLDSYGESHSLEFAYLAPSKVVTGCDEDGNIQYDWTCLENILDDIKSRNHQAIVRFFYEYPGVKMVDDKPGTTGVPAYIKALPDYKETYKNVAGDGETYYADWSNSELKRFTKQFYTDFADRYEKDVRIAFVEVGFGHWSEYHIYDANGVNIDFGRNFPTKEYQKEFFVHFSNVMANIPWAVSINASDSHYTPFSNDRELMNLSFGLFDDSFMHEGHEISSGSGYNERCWDIIGKDRWKTGVCGGEVSYYTSRDQAGFTNPEGMYGHTWEEQSAKYHITFMIANDNPSGKNPYNNAQRFKECSMATGYHFIVSSCKSDGTETRITVRNEGVAPIYRDAYFAIGSIRSSQTLRGLLPGEQMEVDIPAALECDDKGNATANPVIACDYILDTQNIEYEYEGTASNIKNIYSVTEGDKQQRYNISGVKVKDNYQGVVISNGQKFYAK